MNYFPQIYIREINARVQREKVVFLEIEVNERIVVVDVVVSIYTGCRNS